MATEVPCQATSGNGTNELHVKGPVWGPQLLSHGTVEAKSFSLRRPQLCLDEPGTGNLQSFLFI